jgi:hypothetical protein
MVTITRPNVFPIPMPKPDEMAGLLSITRAALFPKAPPLGTYDWREFFESFAVAFQYISTLRRSTELKHRADLWIDRCENWAHERHGEHVGIGLSAFMCAIAAAGDVDYRIDLPRWPYDIYVGLAWNDGPAATATGWIQVLATKEIRASVPASRSPYPEPTPTIVQMDLMHGQGARPFE